MRPDIKVGETLLRNVAYNGRIIPATFNPNLKLIPLSIIFCASAFDIVKDLNGGSTLSPLFKSILSVLINCCRFVITVSGIMLFVYKPNWYVGGAAAIVLIFSFIVVILVNTLVVGLEALKTDSISAISSVKDSAEPEVVLFVVVWPPIVVVWPLVVVGSQLVVVGNQLVVVGSQLVVVGWSPVVVDGSIGGSTSTGVGGGTVVGG